MNVSLMVFCTILIGIIGAVWFLANNWVRNVLPEQRDKIEKQRFEKTFEKTHVCEPIVLRKEDGLGNSWWVAQLCDNDQCNNHSTGSYGLQGTPYCLTASGIETVSNPDTKLTTRDAAIQAIEKHFENQRRIKAEAQVSIVERETYRSIRQDNPENHNWDI